MFDVRDGKKMLFRMMPAFSGSFMLEAGFIENLTVDMSGEAVAHVFFVFIPYEGAV